VTSALDAAVEALTAAGEALATATADAVEARRVFEERPSTKAHNAMAIAEQLARNSVAPVEAAKVAVEQARRAGLEERLADAVSRASHSRLYEHTAPARARLVALFSDVSAVVGEIVGAVREQHRGVTDAERISKELGVFSPAPRKVAPTFLRQMVGILIADAVYRAGAKFPLGGEPHSWLAPRAEPPSPHPSRDEWRGAKRLVLPDAYLPPPVVDHHLDLADVAFFNTMPTSGRPSRGEVES